MPPPPGMGGIAGFSFGSSATMASAVTMRPATEAMVAELPKDKPAMPPMPGGMDY